MPVYDILHPCHQRGIRLYGYVTKYLFVKTWSAAIFLFLIFIDLNQFVLKNNRYNIL